MKNKGLEEDVGGEGEGRRLLPLEEPSSSSFLLLRGRT
jgi:hypothetical protein